MKILAIHNFHRKGSSSGDDQVFKKETAMLESNGHTVIRYTVINDSFDNLGIGGKIVATLSMFWSFKNYRAIKELCKKECPDIVHVHTFFPLLSPSILYAAKRSGCKVVATLHDTRFICPCATSLCGTELCNECGDGRYHKMIKNKCFKGSGLQSLIVAFIFKYHRIRKSFYKQIDKYICLNDSQIALLKNVGFDENKIVKKYNFVESSHDDSETTVLPELPQRYVVFYGRIGVEKGINELMQIWEGLEIPLVVMGNGPMEEIFEDWANARKNVYFLGYTKRDKCLSIVRHAEFVVFPSIVYEGCSMVEIEAESLGKGIVATDLGFSQEAIKEGYNGCKVKLGDISGFRDKVIELWGAPDVCRVMGENARKDYEQKYTQDMNYQQLVEIYSGLAGK